MASPAFLVAGSCLCRGASERGGKLGTVFGDAGCCPHPIMNLLRRAANETVGQLGFNIPTAITAILAIGFAIVLVNTFSAPKTDSVTGFVLWSLKSIAWFLAVIVVFIPAFAWNIFKVASRQRSVIAHLEMAAESAAAVDDQMKSFLRNNLSDPWYGVVQCYGFGSIAGKYPTRDVDIIIQFDSAQRSQVRTYRDRLRNIESSFQEVYNLKLHVQMFLSDEDDALRTFLSKAGLHERMI